MLTCTTDARAHVDQHTHYVPWTCTAVFECCRGQAASVCAVNLLGIVQLVVQFVCFYLIVLLYFIFFPRERRRVARAAARGAHAAPGAEDMPSRDVAHATLLGDDNYHGEITAEWRRSLVIGWTLILFNVVVVAVSALLLFNAEVTRDVEERQRLVDGIPCKWEVDAMRSDASFMHYN